MSAVLLTQSTTFIIGPISKILGVLINVIFNALDAIGMPNVGLAIILFTIVMYILMIPLNVKQQKFSKLSARMNPEVQAIQKKYAGKKDNISLTKQNDEIQAVYAKYGVSPTGSCLPLLVQMPVLFALYRVIYAMPAYIDKIKNAFFPLVDEILADSKAVAYIQETTSARMFAKQSFTEANTIIDVLNRFSIAEWDSFAAQFPSLAGTIQTTRDTLNHFNSFLGMNMAETPWNMIKTALAAGAVLAIIGALVIPVLSGLTQWLNVKLMGTQTPPSGSGDPQQESMQQSMKIMNNMMPLMSVYFCFILPAGLGIYWVASAVVRIVQQIFINRHIDKIDWDAEIQKNIEKYNAKREKQGLPAAKAGKSSSMAHMNTKEADSEEKAQSRRANRKSSTEYYNNSEAKPGSLKSKARMVEQFNERNKQ